jgi:hypothetical protein
MKIDKNKMMIYGSSFILRVLAIVLIIFGIISYWNVKVVAKLKEIKKELLKVYDMYKYVLKEIYKKLINLIKR